MDEDDFWFDYQDMVDNDTSTYHNYDDDDCEYDYDLDRYDM